MRNKRWHLAVALLVCTALVFVYVRGKVSSTETAFDASRTMVKPAAFDKGFPSFSPLVKQVRSAIVNISTTTVTRGPDLGGGIIGPQDRFKDFFGEDFFERFFGDMPKREFKQRSLGSGFIIDREGYILTNNHVVEKAQSIKVKLTDQKEYDATVVGRDQRRILP